MNISVGCIKFSGTWIHFNFSKLSQRTQIYQINNFCGVDELFWWVLWTDLKNWAYQNVFVQNLVFYAGSISKKTFFLPWQRRQKETIIFFVSVDVRMFFVRLLIGLSLETELNLVSRQKLLFWSLSFGYLCPQFTWILYSFYQRLPFFLEMVDFCSGVKVLDSFLTDKTSGNRLFEVFFNHLNCQSLEVNQTKINILHRNTRKPWLIMC